MTGVWQWYGSSTEKGTSLNEWKQVKHADMSSLKYVGVKVTAHLWPWALQRWLEEEKLLWHAESVVTVADRQPHLQLLRLISCFQQCKGASLHEWPQSDHRLPHCGSVTFIIPLFHSHFSGNMAVRRFAWRPQRWKEVADLVPATRARRRGDRWQADGLYQFKEMDTLLPMKTQFDSRREELFLIMTC